MFQLKNIKSCYSNSCATRVIVFEIDSSSLQNPFIFFHFLPFLPDSLFHFTAPLLVINCVVIMVSKLFLSLLLLSLFFILFPHSLLFFSLNLLSHTLIFSFTLYSYSLMVLNKQEEVVYPK